MVSWSYRKPSALSCTTSVTHALSSARRTISALVRFFVAYTSPVEPVFTATFLPGWFKSSMDATPESAFARMASWAMA